VRERGKVLGRGADEAEPAPHLQVPTLRNNPRRGRTDEPLDLRQSSGGLAFGATEQGGFPTNEVFAEDFGWCIPVRRQSRTVYVACASTDETAETWQVFAFADGGLLARLFGKKEVDPVASVLAAIRKCLESEPNIHELREEASGSPSS